MKKIYPVFFSAVVFPFSALMLIFSLLCSIKLSAVNDRVRELDEQCRTLMLENERLTAEYESLASIDKVEKFAVSVLGMQQCEATQIVYIEMKEQVG